MAKKIIKTSLISATVGAAVGAAAIALSDKQTRDKAAKAVTDIRKTTAKKVNTLYKVAKSEGEKVLASKAKVVTKKAGVKKKIVKKGAK